MNQKNNGGPAFPHGEVRVVESAAPPYEEVVTPGSQPGISARDYFAAAALQGVIACVRDHTGATTVKDRCAKAYEYADAMLAERSKGVQG